MSLVAQRRPEHKLRRHHRRHVRSRRSLQALNEGRSISSGDTLHGDAVIAHGFLAQRRPEHKLRRHRPFWRWRTSPRAALNEGRSISSGDTFGVATRGNGAIVAQRRPEHKLRRHGSCSWTTSPARALNEGRSISSGDTGCRLPEAHRRCALNEGRSISSGDTAAGSGPCLSCRRAQRRPEHKLRRHGVRGRHAVVGRRRSTKAGA